MPRVETNCSKSLGANGGAVFREKEDSHTHISTTPVRSCNVMTIVVPSVAICMTTLDSLIGSPLAMVPHPDNMLLAPTTARVCVLSLLQVKKWNTFQATRSDLARGYLPTLLTSTTEALATSCAKFLMALPTTSPSLT